MNAQFEILHIDEQSTESEIQWATDIIEAVNSLSGAAREVLEQIFIAGPTFDGDVISKQGRDELLKHNFLAKVFIANGVDGYQAVTYRGGCAMRLLEVM